MGVVSGPGVVVAVGTLKPGAIPSSPRGAIVAPTCSNCGASDFVWANELKTGSVGGGTLSLRSRGEIPLGTRICRVCGHADLFLRDLAILHQPHTWRPGEFVPITPKPVAPKPTAPTHPHAHAAPPPPPPPPAPAPPAPNPLEAPPSTPLAAAPAMSGSTTASAESSSPPSPAPSPAPAKPESLPSMYATPDPQTEPARAPPEPDPETERAAGSAKPKTTKRRSPKSKATDGP
ncbi:MAG: hypothetical protein L3J77_04235 [Thermoplasmata archaeon]|nr:hypothetical protein [Thermoplasmata archaeon]